MSALTRSWMYSLRVYCLYHLPGVFCLEQMDSQCIYTFALPQRVPSAMSVLLFMGAALYWWPDAGLEYTRSSENGTQLNTQTV